MNVARVQRILNRLIKNPVFTALMPSLHLDTIPSIRQNALHEAILILNSEGATVMDEVTMILQNVYHYERTDDYDSSLIFAAIELLELDSPPRVKFNRTNWQSEDGRGYFTSGQKISKVFGIPTQTWTPRKEVHSPLAGVETVTSPTPQDHLTKAPPVTQGKPVCPNGVGQAIHDGLWGEVLKQKGEWFAAGQLKGVSATHRTKWLNLMCPTFLDRKGAPNRPEYRQKVNGG